MPNIKCLECGEQINPKFYETHKQQKRCKECLENMPKLEDPKKKLIDRYERKLKGCSI